MACFLCSLDWRHKTLHSQSICVYLGVRWGEVELEVMGGGAEEFVDGVGEENRFSIVWDGLLVTLLQGKYDAYSRVG